MNNNTFMRFTLSLCALLFPFFLHSQQLVSDINKSATGSFPTFLRAGTNSIVFTANSKTYGRELFISDGTEAGTKLVTDVSVGNASSTFWDVTAIDTACYFVTNIDANTVQFWRTSLVTPAAVLLKTFPVSGIASGQHGQFTKAGNSVFFITRAASYQMELWKTDGTVAGTSRIFAFANNVFPDKLKAFNNNLVFIAQNSQGINQIWKSDGTQAGTTIIKDVDTQYGVYEFAIYKNNIYFPASDGVTGYEMWQSDGTANGTKLLKDIVVGIGGGGPNNLTVVGDALFFSASDATNGIELWKTDGTTQGTQLVKDIATGINSSFPNNFFAHNSTLFFAADDGLVGVELWKSDGTAQGTQLVKDIWVGKGSITPNNLLRRTSNGDYFFFVADDSLHGKEIWRTDGTTAGTVLLKDIAQGIYIPNISEIIALKKGVYFNAQDGINGAELWQTVQKPRQNW
jgi:trimeric autotransporter adhesin